MTLISLLLLGLLALLAGVVQSTLGFGFGIVFLALGALFVDAKLVSMVSVFASVVINFTLLSQLYRHINLSRLWLVLLVLLLMVPVGVVFLQQSTLASFSLLLGLLVSWSALQQLWPKLNFTGLPHFYLGVPMAALSGLLTGAFNTGGPPLVVYMQSQAVSRLQQIASLQLLLLSGSLLRLEELWRQDLLSIELLQPVWLCCIACVIGSQLGLRLGQSFSEQLFKKVVAGFLLILGVFYISQWMLQ